MERVTVDDVATLYPVGTLDPVGSHKIFSKGLLKPFGTRRSHSVCIIHGNLKTTPQYIKEEGESHDNHHSSRKQVLAKNNQTMSLISTPNTLFCNSCALFAYGLSQHDPPASPKLELFSRSTSLTGKPASTVLRPRAATRAF